MTPLYTLFLKDMHPRNCKENAPGVCRKPRTPGPGGTTELVAAAVPAAWHPKLSDAIGRRDDRMARGRHSDQWSDSDICLHFAESAAQMSESKDH